MELVKYQEQKISFWLEHIASDAMRKAYHGQAKPPPNDAILTYGLSFWRGTNQSPCALRYLFQTASYVLEQDVLDDIIDIIVHYDMFLYDTVKRIFLYLYTSESPCTRKQVRDALSLTARQVRDSLATLVTKGMAFEEKGVIRPILTYKNWHYGVIHAGKLPENHPHFCFQVSTPAKRRQRNMNYDVHQACVKLFGASEQILLQPAGENIMISCPFHTDKTPSMVVFPEGNWYCHSCKHKGIDILELVAQAFFEDDPLRELRAAEELSSYSEGYVFEDEEETKRRLEQKKLRYQAEVEGAKRRYHYQYSAPEFYHPHWDDVTHYVPAQYEMLTLGFLTETLEKHRLYAFDADPMYPIVIPLIDENRNIVGEQKLSTPSVRRRYTRVKKYMTTPGLEKQKHIYGLITNDPVLLVVEGYKDLMIADQRGMHNVCTTLGSEFSDEQARIIAQRYKKVICGYDPDKPGMHGFKMMQQKLGQYGIPVVWLNIHAKDIHASNEYDFNAALMQAFASLRERAPQEIYLRSRAMANLRSRL